MEEKEAKNSNKNQKKPETAQKFPAKAPYDPNWKSNLLLEKVLTRYKGRKYTTFFIAKIVPRGTISTYRKKKERVLLLRIADHSVNLKRLFQGDRPPDYVLSVTIANHDTARQFRRGKKPPVNVIELDYDSSFTADKILEDISLAVGEITRKIQGEKGNLVPAKRANHG
jgi:hypothetical protein